MAVATHAPIIALPRPAGIILAGGHSRRMGGLKKPLLDLGGRPVLAHVIERLSPQVSELALNANDDPGRFDRFQLPVIADAVQDYSGPLAGILAAMLWAKARSSNDSHVVTVPGDAPFLPGNLTSRLQAAVAPNGIAVAASQGRLHPVFGLWPLALADVLARDLASGVRSVAAWCAAHQAAQVDFDLVEVAGRCADPFFNANTPLDLAEARLILQRLTYASPVIGVAGWKDSGKTTLVARLVEALTQRERRISTIKFSHHSELSASHGAPDTDRHLAAGAQQAAFAAPQHWTILDQAGTPGPWNEARGEPHATLAAIISAMRPADLILVEGFKQASIPKIEVRRQAQPDLCALADPQAYVFAIAADHSVPSAVPRAWSLDNVAGITSDIERIAGWTSGERA